eukprot:1838227-Rhodomonas_salina.2
MYAARIALRSKAHASSAIMMYPMLPRAPPHVVCQRSVWTQTSARYDHQYRNALWQYNTSP